MTRPTILAIALALTCLTSAAVACLWDYDTLAMERQRFPNALELITGKFLRHSPEFYEWRVQDRERRLQADPANASLYDDLGVAYLKLGNHAKAIEVMLQKTKAVADSYETHANLGTFYIYAGQLEPSVEEIDRAIAINPDAHFGRELYQRHLVRYLMSKQRDGTTQFPLDSSERYDEMRPVGFATYVLKAQVTPATAEAETAELQKATQGVLGMMRFANHASPLLLEALGDLLLSGRNRDVDAKQLATRAYLKASYESQDDAARATYRKMAEESLRLQTIDEDTSDELSLAALEKEFLGELAEAQTWYQAVEADERAWISSGKNPDEEFTRKYYSEPAVSDASAEPVSSLPRKLWPWPWLIIVPAFVALVVWIRRRSRLTDSAHPVT